MALKKVSGSWKSIFKTGELCAPLSTAYSKGDAHWCPHSADIKRRISMSNKINVMVDTMDNPVSLKSFLASPRGVWWKLVGEVWTAWEETDLAWNRVRRCRRCCLLSCLNTVFQVDFWNLFQRMAWSFQDLVLIVVIWIMKNLSSHKLLKVIERQNQ